MMSNYRVFWLALIMAMFALIQVSAVAQNAVTYQLGPTHNGAVDFANGFKLPARIVWKRNLHSKISYPIIALNRVFVTTGGTPDFTPYLYCLSLSGGGTLWSVELPEGSAALAYNKGKLFVLSESGQLTAFNAVTGTLLWRQALRSNSARVFRSAPVAHEDEIYLVGEGSNSTLYSISAGDGSIRWTSPTYGGFRTSVTLTETSAYLSASGHVYRFDRSDGDTKLLYYDGSSGGAGGTAVLYRGRLFTRNVVVPRRTLVFGIGGSLLGDLMESDAPPAFGNGVGYFLNNYGVWARDASTFEIKWWNRFPARSIDLGPLVINGRIILTSFSGSILILDGITGKILQKLVLDDRYLPYSAPEYDFPMRGMAAAHGTLVIPRWETLVAVKGAP